MAGDKARQDGDYDQAISEYKECMRFYAYRDLAIDGVVMAITEKVKAGDQSEVVFENLESSDQDLIDEITGKMAEGKTAEAHELLGKVKNEALRNHLTKIYFHE